MPVVVSRTGFCVVCHDPLPLNAGPTCGPNCATAYKTGFGRNRIEAEKKRRGGALMPLQDALFASDNSNWGTPDYVFDPLHKIFKFDFDAAASAENAKLPTFITEEEDCLRVDWHKLGSVAWLNPPYGDREFKCGPDCKKKTCAKRGWHREKDFPGIGEFLHKALDQTRFGVTTVALLPVRMGSQWWLDWVRAASDLYEFEGRIRFEGAPSSAPFPSVLAVYRPAIVVDGNALRRWSAVGS